MQRLTAAQLASKLSFLGPASQNQLHRYLRSLIARHYATGTIEAVITYVKRFHATWSRGRFASTIARVGWIALCTSRQMSSGS
jgi:hypothetical protein